MEAVVAAAAPSPGAAASENLLIVARVLAKWMVSVHAPCARRLLAAACVAPHKETHEGGDRGGGGEDGGATGAGRWTIKVEAGGSGAVIVGALKVSPVDTVGDTKRRIRKLWDAQQHAATQLPEHFSLFVEHGGPELDVHALSLRGCKVRDGSTLVVLASDERKILNMFFEATGGARTWTTSTNWGSPQPLHEWHGVKADQTTGAVSGLAVKLNQLTGHLIPQIAHLRGLTALGLGQNKLSGPIPTELGCLANLRRLELCENSLTGQLPTELGKLSKLEILELNHNKLRGPLPTELGNLTAVTHLYLWSNPLSGPIPVQLKNLRHSLGLVDMSETNLESQPYLTSKHECSEWLDEL